MLFFRWIALCQRFRSRSFAVLIKNEHQSQKSKNSLSKQPPRDYRGKVVIAPGDRKRRTRRAARYCVIPALRACLLVHPFSSYKSAVCTAGREPSRTSVSEVSGWTYMLSEMPLTAVMMKHSWSLTSIRPRATTPISSARIRKAVEEVEDESFMKFSRRRGRNAPTPPHQWVAQVGRPSLVRRRSLRRRWVMKIILLFGTNTTRPSQCFNTNFPQCVHSRRYLKDKASLSGSEKASKTTPSEKSPKVSDKDHSVAWHKNHLSLTIMLQY